MGVFIGIGLIGGLYNTGSDFSNLIFKDLGADPSKLGIFFAASSVVGIIGGYIIHYLRNMSLRTYALIDVCVFVSYYAAVGLSRNLWVALVGFVLTMGWWRLRTILYQYHLLDYFC